MSGRGFRLLISRIFKGVLIAVLVLVVIAALGIVVPRPLWRDEPALAERSHRILMLSNPIHTDIAIPVDDDLIARFGFLRAAGLDLDNPNLRYLVFGWGGRSFYVETRTWADLKIGPVLKSFTLDRSVIHAELAGEIPDNAPGVTALSIDADGLEALTIAATLAGESDIAFWAGSCCIQSVRLAQPRSSPVGEKGGERH